MAAALCLAAALSGCTAASVPPPNPTDAEIDSIMAEYVAQYGEGRAVEFPEVWNNVEFERFVSVEEAPAVLDKCLRGFGADVSHFGPDGSFGVTTSSDDPLGAAAVEACYLAFPYDYQRPLVQSDAQLKYSYNYAVTFLVPCLRAAGYALDAPPAQKEYLALAGGGLWVWSPYDSLSFASDRRWSNYPFDSPELVLGRERLNDRCPQYPEGMEPDW